MKKIKLIIKQFFCIHDYKDISNMDLPSTENNEIYACNRFHKCTKCDKEELKGIGIIC
jgi:hypothetical protein